MKILGSVLTFVATKSLTSLVVPSTTTVDDDEVDEKDVSAVMSVAWIKFSKPVSVDKTENLCVNLKFHSKTLLRVD